MGAVPLLVTAKGLRQLVWPRADAAPPPRKGRKGRKDEEGWRAPDRQPANRVRRSNPRRPSTVPGVDVVFRQVGETPAATPRDRPTPQDAPVDPETGASVRDGEATARPTTTSARSTKATSGLVADLERLAGLRDSGAIDDGEYERAKDVVLGLAEEDA